MKYRFVSAALTFAFAVAGLNARQEQPTAAARAESNAKTSIELSAVPAPVQEALKVHAPDSQVETIHKGEWEGTVYELSFESAKTKLQVAEDGTILNFFWQQQNGKQIEIDETAEAEVSALPERVQNAAKRVVPGSTIASAQKGRWSGDIYQVDFRDGGQFKELQLTEAGTVVMEFSNIPRSAIATIPGEERFAEGAQNPDEQQAQAREIREAAGAEPPAATVELQEAQSIKMEDLPEDVRETVQQQARGQEIDQLEKGTHEGQTFYRAIIEREDSKTTMLLKEDGSLVTISIAGTAVVIEPAGAEAANLELQDLPEAVRKTLREEFGIRNAQSIKRQTSQPGEVIYEISVQQDGQSKRYRITEEGKVLR